MEYTQEMIDRYLSNNFDGDNDFDGNEYDEFDGLEVLEDYDGTNDENVEFFDGADFKSLTKSTKRIGIKITNSGSQDKVLAITPGNFRTLRAAVVDSNNKYKLPDSSEIPAPQGKRPGDVIIDYKDPSDIIKAGIIIDAVLDDGQLLGNLFAESTTSERSLRSFLKYLEQNPTIFAGMQIASNNTQVYETEMRIKRTTPYALYGEEIIPFQDAFKSENSNDKKIFVSKEFLLSSETVATLRIPADTVVTFTLIASAVSNAANSLAVKKSIAQNKRGRLKTIRRKR